MAVVIESTFSMEKECIFAVASLRKQSLHGRLRETLMGLDWLDMHMVMVVLFSAVDGVVSSRVVGRSDCGI